jgi:uncharacterized membrane protein
MSLAPILTASLAIQIHVAAAILAMALGAVVLFRPKGTPIHKLMGRLWAVLMLVVATSAIFINEIRLVGPFSPIHLFVLLTYAGIGFGIWEIRHGRVQSHQATMKSTYLGALLLTGAFTLLPGRRMHEVLFGVDSGWLPSLVAIPLVLAATAYLWRRLMPRRVKATAAP